MFLIPINKLNIMLLLAGGASLLLSGLLGVTPISFVALLKVFFGAGDSVSQQIIFDIRLPRALAAWLVGCMLGMSGAALQGLLRNPLAEPGVLGVSASAVLGSTVFIFYGIAGEHLYLLPLASIAGALIATFFISLVAQRGVNMIVLILVGVGLSSFAGALMALMMNLAPNPFTLSDMVNWTLGSVAFRSLEDIFTVLPFMGLGLVILWRIRRSLSVLTLGEEAARALGVNLVRLRLGVVIATGLMTGASVALAGAIGFIGIIAPHIIRPFIGYNPAQSLLPSGLLAGLILVLADIIVRVLSSGTELKLGVVAALIGAPIFVLIALGGIHGKKA